MMFGALRLRTSGFTCILAAPLLLLPQTAAASSQDDWATASDIGVGALAAWSIGVPLAQGDNAGALQAGGSMAASYLVATGLKETFPETRPDGSDRRSFPSGHTSVAFGAATSIWNRRGDAEGIPALAVAGLVGLARVQADKHHWYDVVAGAAVGTASGLLITHDRSRQSETFVWGDAHSGGLTYVARF